MKLKGLTALLPALWLTLFFVLPFLLVAKLSLSDAALAMPPYAPRIDWRQGLGGFVAFVRGLDLETYARLTHDRLYLTPICRACGSRRSPRGSLC